MSQNKHTNEKPLDLSDERKRALKELNEEDRYGKLCGLLIKAGQIRHRSFSLLVALAFFIFKDVEMKTVSRRRRLVSWFTREIAGDKWQRMGGRAKTLVEDYSSKTDADAIKASEAKANEASEGAEEHGRRKATVIGYKIVLGRGFDASLKAARENQYLYDAFSEFISEKFSEVDNGTRCFISYKLVDDVLPWVEDEDQEALVDLTCNVAGETEFRFPSRVWRKFQAIKHRDDRQERARRRKVRQKRMARRQIRPKTAASSNGGNGAGTHGTLGEQIERALQERKLITADAIVASRHSNRYHRASSVNINKENIVVFSSEEEAQEAGYEPSANFS